MAKRKGKGITMLDKLAVEENAAIRESSSQMLLSSPSVQQRQLRSSNTLSQVSNQRQSRSKEQPQVQSSSTMPQPQLVHVDRQPNRQSINPPISQSIPNMLDSENGGFSYLIFLIYIFRMLLTQSLI